jgi:hypothetical protein
MAESFGYVYRRSDASRDDLRDLLTDDSAGWAWTPAFMYTHGARRADNLLRGEREQEEGCASRQGIEVRWRAARTAEPAKAASDKRYDVLVLALAQQSPQSLPGFTPLPPDGAPWRIEQTTIRLQHPLGTPAEPDGDEQRTATCFLSPDGSIQFVALIGASAAPGGGV